jgi:hypothetical protein
MLKNILILLFLAAWNLAGAQNPDCKVVKPEISGSYSGGCKNGLAQGKGIAQGTDRYEGQFVKGLPNGKGKYTWADGIYYEGQWKFGIREGKGKMVYPDSVVTGYWKEDKYVGKKLMPPYKIVSILSVTRYTFTKTPDKNLGIKIHILQGGHDNISIEDFSMLYDSGFEYRNVNYYGIENVTFPLNVKIRYRSWNYLRTAQYDVKFEFVINDPGSWDVIINN